MKFVKCLVVIFILIFLVSCGEDGTMIGSGFVDSSMEVIATDTLTIKASSVLMDSVVTDDATNLLVGSYQDDYLGTVYAKGFVRFSVGSGVTISETAQYDSLSLRLKVNYHYGDAGARQQFSLYRVLEDIEPAGDNTQLYNFDDFETESASLASVTITPENKDSLEILLPQALGLPLFEAFQNEGKIVEDQEHFEDYLKGIAISNGNASNTSIFGFQADSTAYLSLRLHYTETTDGVVEQKYYDFNLYSHFSNIQGDRKAPLNKLESPKESIKSTESGNQVFIQNGVGIMTRLDFPTIDNLFDVGPNLIINGAELYLFPLAQSYEEETPLPDPLMVYVGDVRHRIIGSYTDDDGNTISASPTVDEEFNQQTYYKLDISEFVREELDTDRITGNGLLLTAPASQYQGNVNRTILGGPANAGYKMYVSLVVTKLN
ncbi:DUF4270 family protein [Gracilimonas mengyeensis]|uniref:DUF4270 domain-containing protein n=1 Tax=Gracilimonas mengyeensis TaxID=1302730 RepID=A0A521BV29_9BACT|nr:DUF4270 family protein [Gracilimonas mengyeensis]SMO51042.1 protein of unknown function [Gracilimonas mengyeensis]